MLFAGLVLAASRAASAQTKLFEFPVPVTFGELGGRVDTVSFPISFLNERQTRLFEGLSFTHADEGRTITVTRATDPKFDGFTAMLTDGRKGQINFEFYPEPDINMSGIVFTDSLAVWGNENDSRIDLKGKTVDAYTLRIDQLTIYPRERGGFDARITFAAFALPEPGGALVLAPLAGLLMRRRRTQGA
jgi:hypothetical protein